MFRSECLAMLVILISPLTVLAITGAANTTFIIAVDGSGRRPMKKKQTVGHELLNLLFFVNGDGHLTPC